MGLITENVSLKEYSSYRTGGNARYFASPTTVEELQSIISWAKSKSLNTELLGGGSNVLISDDGYDGLVVLMTKLAREITHNRNLISVSGGNNLMSLVNYSVDNGMAGLEMLAGIPGTVGGAIKMNAGAYGQEIKDTLKSIVVINSRNELETISNSECRFGYRKSCGIDGCIVVSAEFYMKRGDKEHLQATKQDILLKRNENQPLDKPSCGSVFKRPIGNYAGALIEQCGLKGHRVGGAVISEKHANFILNVDNATSQDILSLINEVQSIVFRKTGVSLECEVRFIGF